MCSARITPAAVDDTVELRDDMQLDGQVRTALWTTLHPSYAPSTRIAVFGRTCKASHIWPSKP